MAKKSRKIVQCPYCDSNRLYFRRGLVSDVLISLLTPVRSYTCGSCSRSFRRYGNYFTSKQAMIHIFGLLAALAFINPQVLNPQNWFLEKESTKPVEQIVQEEVLYDETDDLPLLSMAVVNASNGSLIAVNGTIPVAESYGANSTIENTGNKTFSRNETASTIMSFNSTEFANATEQTNNSTANPAPESIPGKHGLQMGKLKSIYFKAIDGKTRINLDLGGSPLSYTSFFLSTPERLVVDIHGNWEYYGPTTLRPENPIFSRFRIGIYEDKIRMVMDLKGQTPAPLITKTATGLNIDVK